MNHVVSKLACCRVLLSCIGYGRDGLIPRCVDAYLPTLGCGVSVNRVESFNLLFLVTACQGKRSVSVGIVGFAHPRSPAPWYTVCKNLELRNSDLITP